MVWSCTGDHFKLKSIWLKLKVVKGARNKLVDVQTRLVSSKEEELQLAKKEYKDKLRHWSGIEDNI